MHYKDIKIYQDKLNDVGIMAYPLKYMTPKLCGLGDVDWGKYASALTDIGYQGYSVIEVEDKAFEGSLDNAKKAVKLSAKYLRPLALQMRSTSSNISSCTAHTRFVFSSTVYPQRISSL